MNRTLIRVVATIILVSIFSSCTSSRKLTYFDNLNNASDYKVAIRNVVEPTIQPNDILGISVSSLSAESNALFNNGVMQNVASPGLSAMPAAISSGGGTPSAEGYQVDKNGNINFPVLGSIKLAGLTRAEAADKLAAEIRKSVKNPIVNVRYLNFRITVIGEVSRPATFTVPTDRINVLEALGLAGDMTPFGKRDNVLIIREKEGVRSATRINFNDKELLNSPYFYLQQNDVVYVEPIKAKALQGSASTFYLPIISLVVSVVSVLAFTLRR